MDAKAKAARVDRLRQWLPLATLDVALARAAVAEGVPLVGENGGGMT